MTEQSARAASPLLAVGGASIAKEHSLSESAVIVAPVAHRPKPPPPAIPSDVEPFKGQLAPFQEEGGGCLICAEPGGSLPKKCRVSQKSTLQVWSKEASLSTVSVLLRLPQVTTRAQQVPTR